MITFVLAFNCDNAAFADDLLVPEIKRLLKLVRWRFGEAAKANPAILNEPVTDVNGNTIGKWYLDYDDGLGAAEVTSAPCPVDDAENEYEPRIEPDRVPGTKRDYPAKKRKKTVKSRYLDPDAPLDTPSLDTSFHDGEMDV